MKFIKCKTTEGFNQKLEEGLIEATDIVFNEETQEIWTHGKTYGASGLKWSILEGGNEAVVTINNSDTSPVVQVEGDTDWIQGKRCLVKQTADGVAICYLSDTDSTKFTDGSDAALDGTMGEYMVHFPANTVKCEVDANDNDILTIAEDGDGFKFREVLLGAVHMTAPTEGTYDPDTLAGAKWSTINGKAPMTKVPYYQYHQFIQQTKGQGWSIMDYEARNKVTMLCFAKYGTRDLQAVVGLGDANYGNVEGSTVTLGNAHGIVNNTDGKINNSILGIENYFNNVADWMGGLDLSLINGRVNARIYDGCVNQDGSGIDTYRSFEIPTSFASELCIIKRMKYGEYADLFPATVLSQEEQDDLANNIPEDITQLQLPYYADTGFVLGQDQVGDAGTETQMGMIVAYCGGSGAYPVGGGSVLDLGVVGPSVSNPAFGARLQYRGNITIIDNPTDFKNL